MQEDPGNYRTVSLTSAPGKIMAELIWDPINKELKDGTIN